ncbi:biogenesis of lysosome-related organelles complex 1 subunit 5 isoform X1 [Loxodonta africana]|uniref:biogenesis of lysosome-related organelles complex 1 subunit 5 isoform X1 n=1 Tax=Loxodonta africana TaxID=9785 RepID=UPI0030CA8DF8
MSGGGTETPVGCEAAPGGGVKKRESLGTAGSPAHLIIKDLGEIHSRLLDHRPVIQGETRYFVKEFEEKRGLREMRVLENLKNMIHETNEHALPRCKETMQDSLNQVLQRLQAANHSVCRLQQKEQEQKKLQPLDKSLSSRHLIYKINACSACWLDRGVSDYIRIQDIEIHNDHLLASENQHVTQWEDFMREQHNKQAEVDEEHRKAMERLKEQYAEMEKDLAKFSTF